MIVTFMPPALNVSTKTPFLPAALCVTGMTLAVLSHLLWLIPALAGLLLVIFSKSWRELLLCLILGGLACGHALDKKHAYRNQFSLFKKMENQAMTVEGSVVRSFSHSVWLDVPGQPTRIDVILPEGTIPALGERWFFEGIVKPIEPPHHPGLFDRQSWFEANGVVGRLSATNASCRGIGSYWSRLLAFSDHCRRHIISILQTGALPDDKRPGIMASLLLGDKSGLDDAVYHQFRASGSLHIFAVSGLHIGMAAILLLAVLNRTGMHPIRARLLAFPLLLVYVFVTGMPISAVRALIMTGILFAATACRRRNNAINTLSFTAIIFLLWNPTQVLDAGFQLSFALFGTVAASAMWQQNRRPFWTPDPFIPPRIYTRTERFLANNERRLRILVVLAVAGWLVSAPLTLAHFGTFNLYSPLVNIAIAPLIPLMMGGGMLALACSWCQPLLLWVNEAGRLLAGVLLTLVQGIASLPCSLVSSMEPAGAGQFMLIPHRDASCSIVIGNPGLLIDGGSRENIRYETVPILLKEGFSPRAHLLSKPRKQWKAGAGELAVTWPRIRQLGSSSSLALPHKAGRGKDGMIIYPGSSRYGIMDDECPVVSWRHNGKKLLCLGDAAYYDVLKLPGEALRADVLIVGHHDRDPIDQPEWLIGTGAATIIFTTPPDHHLERLLRRKTSVFVMDGEHPLKFSMDALPGNLPVQGESRRFHNPDGNDLANQ